MSQVTVGENEGIESALRRFKRSVAKAGIFSDLRRIRHHETPVEKYKRKLKQRSRNRRRWARNVIASFAMALGYRFDAKFSISVDDSILNSSRISGFYLYWVVEI